MHIHALFVHDQSSHIVSVNSWEGEGAPRFYLGRTEQGNIWRFRNDLPKVICKTLSQLCAAEAPVFTDRPKHEADFLRILSAHAPITRIWYGPAYWFANSVAVETEAILITEQNAFLLRNGFQAWIPDVPYQQPFMGVMVNGRIIAVCASVRISDVAHEAGVETLMSHRQKGYAVKAVAAWAAAVAKRGLIPLYSTSIENIASQRVATKLGLVQYGTDYHIT